MQALLDRSVTGVPPIPAMTTDAERECYYRLAKECASKGAIVELGAWMGASTAYIAAGIRDSGVRTKVQVYDKFHSKPGHIRKVKEFYAKEGIDKVPLGPCLKALKDNLGPLMEFVEPHQGQIEEMLLGDEKISLLITDAPKRIPAISIVLTTLRKALEKDSIMAWQDFCHFPSYEIPACLYRLREHFEFVEAVYPGSTLVFRVRSKWKAAEVAKSSLDVGTWTPREIAEAWDYWLPFVHEKKRAIFHCGRAMFLCDIGQPEIAVSILREIYDAHADEIMAKWRYLKKGRPDFVVRYAPLFQYLDEQEAC